MVNGKEIFNEKGITVHECADGYSISNGVDVIVLGFMPLLDADTLARLFKEDCGFKRYQLAKHGNVIKEHHAVSEDKQNAFALWFTKETELMEMYQMGY